MKKIIVLTANNFIEARNSELNIYAPLKKLHKYSLDSKQKTLGILWY